MLLRSLAVLALMLAAPVQAADRTVAILGLADDVDPRLLDEFEGGAGIKAAYDGYEAMAGVEARALAGRGADVAIVSGPALQRLIAANALRKLDRARQPAPSAQWPAVTAWQGVHDPGANYGVAYQWQPEGLIYDQVKARDRLGEASPNWDHALKPDALRKFADCGVEWPDEPETMLPLALAALKLSPASAAPGDLRRGLEALQRLRPQIAKTPAPGALSDLVNGEACLAVASASDAQIAISRAKGGNGGPQLAFVAPKEGALAQVEYFVVLRDAPHLQAAENWIDFMLTPGNAARNAARTGLAPARAPAAAVPPFAADEALMRRLYAGPDANALKAIAKDWQKLRSDK